MKNWSTSHFVANDAEIDAIELEDDREGVSEQVEAAKASAKAVRAALPETDRPALVSLSGSVAEQPDEHSRISVSVSDSPRIV